MGLFNKKKTVNLPAYTNWDDFVADENLDEDGDDSLKHDTMKHFVPQDLLEKHLKETK